MTTIPNDVLLVRAMSALEMAQLQLIAGRTQDAADNIEKGIELLKEALR